MNMKYRTKLVISLVGTSALVYFLVFTFFITRYRMESLEESKARLNLEVERHGYAILNDLNVDIGITRALAAVFADHEAVAANDIWNHISGNLEKVLHTTDNLLTVWGSFELHEFQPGYDKEYGRKYISAYHESEQVTSIAYNASMEGDDPSDPHTQVKQNPQEEMVEPYWYSVTEEAHNKQLITSFIAPILKGGNTSA